MDYKQILEDVLKLDESITIIRGFSDIITIPDPNQKLGFFPQEKIFKDFNKDSFWVVMGRGSEDLIIESMSEFSCNVDKEGEYEFKAVLRWSPSEYDDYGRLTMRSYLEVEYIEFKFIQTFLERERESKLDTLLDLDNLFL